VGTVTPPVKLPHKRELVRENAIPPRAADISGPSVAHVQARDGSAKVGFDRILRLRGGADHGAHGSYRRPPVEGSTVGCAQMRRYVGHEIGHCFALAIQFWDLPARFDRAGRPKSPSDPYD